MTNCQECNKATGGNCGSHTPTFAFAFNKKIETAEMKKSTIMKIFMCKNCFAYLIVPIDNREIPKCSTCDTPAFTGTRKELINILAT